MSQNKTIPTDLSVHDFLAKVEDENKRKDSYELLRIMQEVTSHDPIMWGNSIVGFGSYHYKYATGREGIMLLTGFSPRKQNISIYIMAGFARYEALMKQLGPHKTGKSCLYIKKLSEVNIEVLKQLITASYTHYNTKYNL